MTETSMEVMRRTSPLSGGNVAYIESLYERYLEDPGEVPPNWRDYFERLPRLDDVVQPDVPHAPIRAHFEMLGRSRHRARQVVPARAEAEHEAKQVRVDDLISAYRHRGHKRARIDPLGMMQRPPAPILDLAYHRLSEADLDTEFNPGTFLPGVDQVTLRELLRDLEATYCGTVGYEYMHITDEAEKLWVQRRIESVRGRPEFPAEQRRLVHERLTAAEGLERYLQSRYPGTKRFGLEGGESLIPLLHETLQRAGGAGIRETVIAMAHRGRLNVLVNILGKRPSELFDEFEGKLTPEQGSGDVKYHQGFSSNLMAGGREMHVALAFNPSHLEIVGPVAEGSVRARQDRRGDDGAQVLPVVLHGDAAFAGQGVVMETFQMSQTRGFRTGGTVHVIVNNQIGFTTSEQADARSTEYCTEVAKMVQAPIFHVNGDDPEAVLFVTQIAVDYRMQFRKDVVIDLVCYRRRGHNEAEEPMKTQPLMYQRIREHPTTLKLYTEALIEDGILSAEDAEARSLAYRDALDAGRQVALGVVENPDTSLFVDWRPYLGHDWTAFVDTRFPIDRFQVLGAKLCEVPEGFVVHRQVQRILDDRREMTAGNVPVNWGYAEMMAYATLLDEGYRVRLVGQDSAVGTFSHRHAVLYNQRNGKTWTALKHLDPGQGPFDVFNSLLSEEAVLAFEYGYSGTTPNALVIWEAQFGDFANGAQVVIDQFITSGEHKWQRLSGITLLLPHGYEGAGPEHSSARLERFLQLCAERNIQVCVPTTPAQVYHMLRRQVVRPLRRPLIVMSPKSLLRHKLATSTLEELTDGQFLTVIGEVDPIDPPGVRRLIMCAGKVYYDLLEARRAGGREDVAILRLEQLYPFPEEELIEALAPYGAIESIVWCQEEPQNQGAWYCSQHHMRRVAQRHNPALYLEYVGREPSAAAAAGYMSLHLEQQARLVDEALNGHLRDGAR